MTRIYSGFGSASIQSLMNAEIVDLGGFHVVRRSEDVPASIPALGAYHEVPEPSVTNPSPCFAAAETSIAPSMDAIERLVTTWQESIVELFGLLNEPFNSETEVTAWATNRTIEWLSFVISIRPDLHEPDVIPSGDGGIDIEWETDRYSLSLHIGASELQHESIYFENEGKHAGLLLNKPNLRELVEQLS